MKGTLENYSFVFPAVLIFSIFYIVPLFWVAQLSMYQWDGIVPTKIFVGFGNFLEIFRDKVWWQSMKQAGYITLIALVFQNALALVLAWACDRDIKAGNIYRVIFYLPPVLSEVVVGLVWRWIYDGNYGLLNYWLQLYEAARVDGAGSWQIFKKVTAPLMIPVFILVSILTVLGTMQVFVLILSMTGGGPGYHTEVPVTRILFSMIGSSRFGYACSQGIVFGAILLTVSFMQIRLSRLNLRTEV